MADSLSVTASARQNVKRWIVPPVLILSLVFFYPLALIVRQALSNAADGITISHFGDVVRTQLFWSALFHTFEIAVAASLGCLLLGFTIALILYFVPFPGAHDIARFIDTFIALPTFLIALAFTFIYGSAGVINGLLIQFFAFDLPPIDFLYLGRYSGRGDDLYAVRIAAIFTFSLIESSQIEVAGSLGAKPAQIVEEIILPAALPALLAGGSLCLFVDRQ